MKQLIDIDKLPAIFFTFELWSAGKLSDINIYNRYYSLLENKHIIRQIAIGYCDGERLSVRPKPNTKAIMFFVKDNHFWTHFSNKEFYEIFQLH